MMFERVSTREYQHSNKYQNESKNENCHHSKNLTEQLSIDFKIHESCKAYNPSGGQLENITKSFKNTTMILLSNITYRNLSKKIYCFIQRFYTDLLPNSRK